MKNGFVDPDSEDGLSKITADGLSDLNEEINDDESDQSSVSDEEESYAQSEPDDTNCEFESFMKVFTTECAFIIMKRYKAW